MLRPSLLVVASILLGGMTLGSALAGQSAPPASPLSRAGAGAPTIQLVEHGGLAPGLSEVRISPGRGTPSEGRDRLLAIAPDGSAAAVASQVGPEPATLTLARRDGTRRGVALPGLIGAGFSPDGSWMAVIDGTGSIWRVPAGDIPPSRIADGPYIGSPVVEADGSLLALRVSSIEAPIVSRLVRVAPDGTVLTLADDQLVYGAQLMADGSVAYAAHEGSRTLLKQLAAGKPRQLADLGEDAVNVVLAPNEDAIAFERGGKVFLRGVGDHDDVLLGPGTRPQFAPDGLSLLVERASGSALLALDGRPLAAFDDQAAFGGCGAGCQP
ncbi:MAG TPA: hypothetical protein VIA82_10450 [Candidatus Limnocylindria bacterium]|jgi:hypothetical protein